MNKLQAIEKLREIFHRTRLTSDISVPPEVVHAILYGDVAIGDPANDNRPMSADLNSGSSRNPRA